MFAEDIEAKAAEERLRLVLRQTQKPKKEEKR